MKLFLPILFLIFISFGAISQVPKIISFSPITGPAGTSVVINGNNFSTIPGNNLVYFGSIKAAVSSATSTAITVTVPAAAISGTVTVIANNLICASANNFSVTFTGNISYTSLGDRIDSVYDSQVRCIIIADLDNDGKPEAIAGNENASTVEIFKNISTNGDIIFSNKTNIPTSHTAYDLQTGDIDGDGKIDIIFTDAQANTVSILRNTSTPGQFSFQQLILNTGNVPLKLAVGDIDNDGKIDIVTCNAFLSPYVCIFRNVSTVGNVAFSPVVNFPVGGETYSVRLTDLNADDKPELIISNSFGGISIFPNTGNPGVISYGAKLDFLSSYSPNDINVADIDGDGMKDLICDVSVLRNTSVVGSISFEPFVNIIEGVSAYTTVADLNGDGKPDVLFTDREGISLLKNISTIGNIKFSGKYFYKANAFTQAVATGDFNADSKPDIMIANDVNGVAFFKNIGDAPFISSFSPDSAGTQTSVTITGKNFTGATNVAFGGTNAASFQVYDSSKITSIVGTGNSGEVKVITPYGSASLKGFTYVPKPFINSFLPSSASEGDTVTIIGSNLSSTLSVSFGITAATSFKVISPNSLQAVVANGTSGSITVTTIGGTVSKQGFIYLPFRPPAITSFSPAGAASGDTVTLVGKYFSLATEIKFGSAVAASFTIRDSSTILAVVGDGSTGNISITTLGGTVASALAFVYYNKPLITDFSPTAATSGETIIIKGKYFTNVKLVTLDSFPVQSYNITTDTTLSIVVGNGGSGNIIIKNNGGTTAIGGFNFIKPARPVINAFLPVEAAADSLVIITGYNFYAVTKVYFGSAPANSFTVVSPTKITATVGSGNTGNISINTLYYSVSKSGFIFKQPQRVLSITPLKGPIGTQVIITNGNFSTLLINNIVYFGAVRATVIAATATTITVKVPAGATYQPITVTVNGETFQSKLSFGVTYPGAQNFAQSSFKIKSCINYYKNNGTVVEIADLDNDGKPDVVALNYSSTVSVFRNITSGSTITFAPKIDVAVGGSNAELKLGDVDGDGKVDLLITDYASNSLNILLNKSTLGNISFQSQNTFATGQFPVNLSLGDLDGDGKMDIVVSNVQANTVSVFRNKSSIGNISLSLPIQYTTGSSPDQNRIADLDNDGKPEIIVTNNGANNISIFKNNSTPGNMQFAAKTDINSGSAPKALVVSDLNDDGKLDIIISNYDSAKITLIMNNSAGGTFNFAPKREFACGVKPSCIAIGNIDGDNYPDVVIPNTEGGSYGVVTILKGGIKNNEFVFESRSEIGTEPYPYWILLADLNADSKPDIVTANSIAFCINQNITQQIVAGIFCRDGSFSVNTAMNGINYQWQLDAASGTFTNIGDGINFSGANTSSLTINNCPANWAGYRLRCMVDGDSSTITILKISNQWLGTVNNNWENPANWSCGKVPDINTDVEIFSGNILISSNITVNTLKLYPEVNLIIGSGYNLTVLH